MSCNTTDHERDQAWAMPGHGSLWDFLGLPHREPGWLTTAKLVICAVSVVLAYVLWEQMRFTICRFRSGGKLVPGPRFAVPFIGCVAQMVMDPYKFWEDQRKFSFPGFSWNSMIGRFMIFTTDADISRHVFNFNDPETLFMAVHPSGKNILGPTNLAFMHGKPHQAIRKSFLSLFTRKALATYVETQDGVIRRHLAEWVKLEGEQEIRPFIRDMNATTSQEVFAGPYLTDPEEREKFSDAFRHMTDGFLAFPICLPGTAVWKGKQGRLFIVSVLEKASKLAKANMKAGREPRCLLDFWAQRCLEEVAEAEVVGVAPAAHTSDHAMAETVMDFLFASQDASTASLVWTTCLMAEYPDVLAKVREEQARVRPDPDALVTGAVLAEMTYTRQVVKEVLRFRPPAPMVPQIAQKDFQLTDDYKAPKGTLIMPSIVAANMQGFTDPLTFDPDRFSPERKEDIRHAKNFLTFGHGPHYCVGKEYAINHLTCYLAILSTSCDWTRRRTCSDASNWQYLPTIYPATSLVTLAARTTAAAQYRGGGSKAGNAGLPVASSAAV
ncbi:hypothetical protein WJX72_002058 [[Myrmecia] bisecta]|uniref:sterol 22-desaturase n=1 Tax=[Myrmecia] bisecta TaxID=41462 RepID=A0AAW1QP76_9CHLO